MTHDTEQWPDQPQRITLIGDDGEELEVLVWDMIELDSREYWLLEPAEPVEGVDEGVWIFRAETNGAGDKVLTPVEDDQEWERVRQALEELDADD
ncbi:MAG TPA: DUF1292 domain-containing protein [Limnochordales bacterium]